MARPAAEEIQREGGRGALAQITLCVCVCSTPLPLLSPISSPPRGLAEVLRAVCSPKLQSPARSLPPKPPCINIRSENVSEASTLLSGADLHGAARRPFELFDT